MPGDERESPRAAIRSWLHDTETKTPKSGPTRADVRQQQQRHVKKAEQPSTRQGSDRENIGLERAATFRTLDVDHRGDQNQASRRDDVEDLEHGSARDIPSQPKEKRNHRHAERQSMQRLDEPGLAEKLGLHAPFRTFRDRSEDEDVDLDVLNRPRKRRRRRSSTGSYLEPAEIHEQTDLERDAGFSVDKAENGRRRRQIHPESRSDHISKSYVMTSPSPEKLAETYARRPRRKTREDRYELKEGNSNRRKKQPKIVGKDKKGKKHKRKEKSGAALMHDFCAQNVSHDRLTLQPAKTLGLFGRGKASSPIRRRGLPDLAFSEMSFLNSRRPKPPELDKPSDTRPAEKSKRRKSIKAADTEAEISRYFTSTKALDGKVSDPQHEQKQRDSHRSSHNRDSPPDFIDLPGTPFLGFGSCGAGSVSPAKRLDNPKLRALERRLTRSPTRSTTYLTWSQSGPPSQVSPRREKPRISPLESSSLVDRKLRSPKTVEAGPLHSGRPSSHDEKSPVQKPRTNISVTPEQIARSRSSHCNGGSPQLEAKRGCEIKHRKRVQEAKESGLPLARDPRRTAKDTSQRRQAHGSPDLHHSNSVSPPTDGTMAKRHGSNANAPAIPRPSDLEVGQEANPLDIALEALLRDVRSTDLKVETEPLRTSGSVLNHTEHAEVTNERRMLHHPHASSPDHSALPPAGSTLKVEDPIPAAGPHTEPYPPSGHESELSRTQRSAYLTPRPSRRSSSRPIAGDYMPHLPHSPGSRRIVSRSSWNGYGNIYEGQQLEIPPRINHHQQLAYHSNEDDGDHGMLHQHLPPSLQQSAGYHKDHAGSGLNEGHDMLPLADTRFEKEAYLDDGAWNNAEENLSAEHGGSATAKEYAYGYDANYQAYKSFQEPNQNEPATITRRPAMLPSTPWNHNSHHTMPSTGEGFNPSNVLQCVAETVPSGFWTPHKLY